MSAGLGIISSTFYAQNNINFGDFAKPVPSVSSLATYTNTPVSNATGIPDISLPLLGVSTYNNGISLSTGLSYNPMNVSDSEPASQVGTGWSLFAGGVISRSIVDDIDEINDNAGSSTYYKNAFDDIYYYNVPGISGKFKMVRDITNNTFKLVNLTANKIKIDYAPSSNTATLIFNSFIITDTKGVQYIFNDYSRSNREQNVYIPGGKIYKSAFFLTQIKDANNIELANFTYQKETKYKNNGLTISYEICKLKTITSPGFGKIEFEYSYDPALENSMNDPYQVQKIILKDNYNHMISGYTFEYTPSNKRELARLKKLNKNNEVSETTEFEYGDAASSASPVYGTDPNSICPGLYAGFPQVGISGILKRVISPSGGVVEYNFEQNDIFIDRTAQSYLDTVLGGNTFADPEVQYMNSFWGVDYDTHQNNNTNYTFTITGTGYKRIFALFVAEELYTDSPVWDPGTPYSMGYAIKSGGTVVTGNPCQSPSFNGNYYVSDYLLQPGTYTLQVGGSGGKGGVYFYEIAHIPQPFKNTTKGIGVRIANIKYYKNKTATTPVKTTKFEYNSFTDSNTSSGHGLIPDGDINASSYIIYKNVKATNADDNNGYVKYYYKIPDDFPKENYTENGSGNETFWPQYNLISSGLLDKKEIYTAQNKILNSEQTHYVFDNISDSEDYFVGDRSYTKLGWIKKLTNTSTTYFDNNQTIEESSETNFSGFNFETASTKNIVDGDVIEKFFTYPESGYPKLKATHIMNIPVIMEDKVNGKLASKTETKFDNTNSTLPTSVVTTNINNGSVRNVTIDQYDDKGNVLQYTSMTGFPTAVVYGYDKTKPIAKIEGATYAQVSSLIQSIVDASNADAANPATENSFLITLDNFRKLDALKAFQITTYTYDPLIGATTVTPPAGIREVYQYDNQSKLQKITDMNGVTLKEYKYNYKH